MSLAERNEVNVDYSAAPSGRVVWKFQLELAPEQILRLPEADPKVLFVGEQMIGGAPKNQIWLEVDPRAELQPYRVWVVGTGKNVPVGAEYLGTTLSPPFVWHLYSPDLLHAHSPGRMGSGRRESRSMNVR